MLGYNQKFVLNVIASNRKVEYCAASVASKELLFEGAVFPAELFCFVYASPPTKVRFVLLVKICLFATPPPNVVLRSICCSELERKLANPPLYQLDSFN